VEKRNPVNYGPAEVVIGDWNPIDMIEITLNEPDDFLKVKETLTRIGIASRREKKLFQSCHILHKQGRYFIVHFKELFMLDGKPSAFTINDRDRRNTIVTLLSDWGLVNVVNPVHIESKADLRELKVISFKDKANWELCVKYNIGNN
jgi:hypothetical protein